MTVTPNTIHNLILLVVAGLIFAFGAGAGWWAFGILSQAGKIVALVVLVVLTLLLVLGLI